MADIEEEYTEFTLEFWFWVDAESSFNRLNDISLLSCVRLDRRRASPMRRDGRAAGCVKHD